MHAATGRPTKTALPVADALDQAAAEAQPCAPAGTGTRPNGSGSAPWAAPATWSRPSREADGDYWAEIRLDIRVRGFARTLAARTALAVSGAAHVLAGWRGPGTGTAASGGPPGGSTRPPRRLPTASCAIPRPAIPTGCAKPAASSISLGQRQNDPRQPGPGRHAAPRSAGGARTPNAAALASASFPVMVTRANARQATAAPAARTASPAPRQPAVRRQ